ncbi:cupin domain-containing protein [Fibrella sp. HMF5335]|uniref:Cupin domain-containing protein n=1 Tax=Fibrella rubiginis TaxID=2817060 RepID=A0A939GF34_9BACT|nr:cupin domain-containing protein [Fibrella rubiginis]MBO0935268.1 cupin domain-containing protein [Fibrella rubiginis]
MNQLVRSQQLNWQPLIEANTNTPRISVKSLRYDEATQRATTFLLKFEAGASYPNHSHPAGEEVFVLDGEVRFGAEQLRVGDYLFTAPGAKHAVYSKTGCTLLFVVPEEVILL